MGFERVTFSYPITRLQSSYLGFADHYSVDFTPEELYQWFDQIKQLKASTSMAILNPRLALTDLQRQLGNRPGRFPCLAGYKYFFVDWHLQVYRCHYLPENLGPLDTIHEISPVRESEKAAARESGEGIAAITMNLSKSQKNQLMKIIYTGGPAY
jgi:MoaA/NifB/PqqE/SkfB family radical SAM enzyme